MIYDSISCTLFAASLLAAACGTAAAQSAKVTVSPSPAVLVGTVSIKDLSSRPATAQAARPFVEMRQHRLPDGSLTSKQSRPAPETLPLLPHNVEVAPSPEGVKNVPSAGPVTSVKGFVGIHSKDQLTANGFELEPPDQGLAVNNNVAAEINNVVLRFFNATTGAPLTAPIALSSLFLLEFPNSSVGDTQAFFDPATSRWFFTQIISKFNHIPFFQLGIAVSETSDPLGSYFQVRAFSDDLPQCFGSDCFPDFPKAGYDANGLYISVNLLGLGFAGAATYALPKS